MQQIEKLQWRETIVSSIFKCHRYEINKNSIDNKYEVMCENLEYFSLPEYIGIYDLLEDAKNAAQMHNHKIIMRIKEAQELQESVEKKEKQAKKYIIIAAIVVMSLILPFIH